LSGVTPQFIPTNLSAGTFSSGNAGNLIVNTAKFFVRDGARVNTTSLASGKAGNLTINASDSIELTGKVTGSINPSLIDSSVNILDENLRQIYNLPANPSGDSGNVTINTNWTVRSSL
ncbi:MAG: hypothetical protein ACRDEA_04660, partial [Microcystaceae cyanobacterium]